MRGWIVSIAIVAAASCGRGKDTGQTLAPAPQAPPKAVAPPIAPAPGQPAPVAPVAAESLGALLPDLAGWTKEPTRSEVVTSPVSYSRAEAHYIQGESTIELVLTDSGFQPLLVAPVEVFLSPGSDERSGGTVRTAVTLSGSPASETWTASARRGEVTVLVARRFIVTATGRAVAGLDPVRAAVRGVNVSRLAGLR